MGVIYNWVFLKYRIVMHGWCLYVNRLLLFVCKLQSQNAWLVNVCMEMTSALVAGGVSMDVGRGTLARIAIELAPQDVWNVSGMVIMRPALCVNLVNMVQAVQNTAAKTAK